MQVNKCRWLIAIVMILINCLETKAKQAIAGSKWEILPLISSSLEPEPNFNIGQLNELSLDIGETWRWGRLGDWGTGRLGDLETGRLGDWEMGGTGRLGDLETWRLGDLEMGGTGRLGDWEMGEMGEMGEQNINPSIATPISQSSGTAAQTITINRFKFEGNTVFTDEELEAITNSFLGRSLTLNELLEIEREITNLYNQEGYLNSGAIIPAEQTFRKQGAIVTVKILEGSLEDIRISVEGRLSPNYIRSRLEKATQPPLNRQKLLEALQLLQINPLVETISAQLSNGSRSDLSVLTVKVVEADTFNVEAFMDNNRVPSVGSTRRGLRLNQGNLLGFGDRFLLEYVNTKGSNGGSFRYTVPINPENGTIGLTGGVSSTEVIQPPFDAFDLDGDSTYIDVTLRQPLLQTPTQEIAFGGTLSYQENQNRVLGVGTSISPGAEPSGRTKVSALRLFQEWSQRGPQDVLSVRSQFNVGVDFFDPTLNEFDPDSDFFTWRLQGQYVRLLAPDTLLLLRTDLQLASDPLLPIEQFRIGGRDTVRGYQQDSVLTDNGFLASVELRVPILRVDGVDGLLQIAPFLDYGAGWDNRGRIVLGDRTLAGYGVGLRWQMGNNFSATFDWGIPLTETGPRTNVVQTNGVYFSIDYRFF